VIENLVSATALLDMMAWHVSAPSVQILAKVADIVILNASSRKKLAELTPHPGMPPRPLVAYVTRAIEAPAASCRSALPARTPLMATATSLVVIALGEASAIIRLASARVLQAFLEHVVNTRPL